MTTPADAPEEPTWNVVSTLVGELADLPPAERSARLDAIADVAVRESVAKYIAALDAGSAIFDRPAPEWLGAAGFGVGGDDTPPSELAERVGGRVGSWRLTRVLGQGGMGAVYEAERDDGEFAQRAALKMLRLDVLPGGSLSRFRRERQLLARLKHRNIATLFDGGVTDDGVPWFAMELVEGEPITRWCASRRLAPEERVRLFRQACGAVQHAHRELVVHRDLKPANILVTADGTVKLLDFGIAKLLDPGATDAHDAPGTHEAPLTRWGFVPATPSYASPEQLDGGPVSTASDIYSLGVVLYELLTGAPPFPAERDPAGHRHRVREESPAPLAARLDEGAAATMGDRAPARIRRWLRGDIEQVARMALRKEPERRYATAEQFAADLDNVLRGLPVLARRDGAGYRFRRFVGRNPIATIVTAILAVGLVVAAVTAADRAREAENAGAAALAAARRAERVTNFLAGVLVAPDPWTGDRNVTVRELLDDASARARLDFGDDPAVESMVRLSLAQSYRGLGRIGDAEREFRGAFARARRLPVPDAGTIPYEAARGIGEMLAEQGGLPEAIEWYDTARAEAGARGDSLAIAGVAADLAWVHGLEGRIDLAREAALLALGVRRRHGAPPADLANALNNLAVVELNAGRPDSAMAYVIEAASLLRDAGPTAEPALASVLATLAGMYSDLGDFARAEANHRESLDLRRRIFGEGHPDEIGTLVNLAVNAIDDGRPVHAEAITDTILSRIQPGGLPPDHPLVAATRTARGRAFVALGDFGRAETELGLALAARRASLPPGHPALAYTLAAQGEAFAGLGRVPEARAATDEAWRILRDAFGDEHPRTVAAAEALRRLGENRR